MKCKVAYVYKNFRYNFLEIDGEHYIVDKDHPFFMFLFPFLHWIFPFTIFKINNEVSPEQLKVPIERRQKPRKSWKIIVSAFLLGLGGYFLVYKPLSKWLTSIIYYFEIDSSIKPNVIVLSVVFSVILLLQFSFSKLNERNLSKHINLKRLETRKTWIRPTSFMQFFLLVSLYIILVFSTLMAGYIFIDEGKIGFLLISAILFCFLLMINIAVVMVGTTKVKFLGDKRQSDAN